jgi:magnesium-transporting ATPase (P-type)
MATAAGSHRQGAFEAIAGPAEFPEGAQRQVEALAAQGHRVIAVAMGPEKALQLAGLIALSDPPREDSPGLIAALGDMHVRTVMVTGDSPVTAAVIAACGRIAAAPAANREQALADCRRDRLRRHAVACQKHDARPPDHLLRRVPVPDQPLHPLAVSQADRNPLDLRIGADSLICADL